MASPNSSCSSLISTDTSCQDYLNTFQDAPDEENKTFEALKQKQMELERSITDLACENKQYRTRYEHLRQKLGDLTDLLEKSAHILTQLYDNSKNALQNTPILDSPISVTKPSCPNQGTGSKIQRVTRPVLHIEPLSMQEIHQEADFGEERTHDCLPIIFEDSLESVNTGVDLHVHLNRLPEDVVENYLNEQNLTSSHLWESSISTDQKLSSVELETMENEKQKVNAKKVKVSPKKGRVAPKAKKRSRSVTKKSKLSSQEFGDSRPQRSTRRKRLCSERKD